MFHRRAAFFLFTSFVVLALAGYPVFSQPGAPEAFPSREYAGTFSTGEKFGVQIGPAQPGRIVAHFYSGGLPGMGANGQWQKVLKGKEIDRRHNILGEEEGWKLEGGVDLVKGKNPKGEAFEATPVVRANPGLGTKPPKGARILFDGGDVKEWKHPRMTAEGFLKAGTETVAEFRDFQLHIEFRLPLMPTKKGQDRANSGVYLQNRYEIQVLDSFALAGSKNECGSIYEYRAPSINACLPPEVWQSYDLEFRAAQFENGKKTKPAWIKVVHNGIVVQDGIEIPKQTGYGWKEGPEPGPIHLQDHGSAVVYRNIWIIETPAH